MVKIDCRRCRINWGRVMCLRPHDFEVYAVSNLSDPQVPSTVFLASLETGVGLAPGIAFGHAGEGYLRLCYAQPEDVLIEAFDRLEAFID